MSSRSSLQNAARCLRRRRSSNRWSLWDAYFTGWRVILLLLFFSTDVEDLAVSAGIVEGLMGIVKPDKPWKESKKNDLKGVILTTVAVMACHLTVVHCTCVCCWLYLTDWKSFAVLICQELERVNKVEFTESLQVLIMKGCSLKSIAMWIPTELGCSGTGKLRGLFPC